VDAKLHAEKNIENDGGAADPEFTPDLEPAGPLGLAPSLRNF